MTFTAAAAFIQIVKYFIRPQPIKVSVSSQHVSKGFICDLSFHFLGQKDIYLYLFLLYILIVF